MKHKYLHFVLAAVVALLATAIQAATVSESVARGHALRELNMKAAGKFMAPVSDVSLAHAEVSKANAARVDYYVFNTQDGNAFVIVPGDDRAGEVIAIGEGCMDVDQAPCNVKWLLEQYRRQMEHLIAMPEARGPRAPRRAVAGADFTIEPLLTCLWSQGTPYNNLCALYDGQLCATGCVATAMAQVMYFWKYPASLPSLPAYVTPTLKIPIGGLPGTTLDWDNMLDKYNRGYNEVQGMAVATLMRYCSQACLMDCSPEASSADELDQMFAFKKFGYNRFARLLRRDDYSADEWDELMLGELRAGRPVAYTGRSDESGGHAFVVDGYDNGMYHINWGWAGMADGYFVLDLLRPMSYEFSFDQTMTCGICPDNGAGELEPAYDFEADGIYYSINGDEATVTYRDCMMNSYSGDVAIPPTVNHGGRTYRVTAVGDMAFANCEDLTSVSLPYIERVGDFAFTSSPSIHTLKVGEHINSVAQDAFFNMVGLQAVEVEDLNAWAALNFNSYYGNPLFYARRLYQAGQEVTDLVLDRQDLAVGDYSFMYCDGIRSVTLGDGVKSVGEYAFMGCPALERVEIGNVDSIGLCAFARDSVMTELVLHPGVRIISPSAFYGCYRIQGLLMPASLQSVGYAAFAYCSSIKDIEFLGEHVDMDVASFYSAEDMTRLKLPSRQRYIPLEAFAYSTSLTDLDLGRPDTIGNYAFYGCSKLTGLDIPTSVKAIGEGAFEACSALEAVEINDLAHWCSIDFATESANPLSESGAMTLGGHAVTDLCLPEDLTSVAAYSFVGCKDLHSVTVPSSVSVIGSSAFKGCSGLSRVDISDIGRWCNLDFQSEYANPLALAGHLYVDGQLLQQLVVPRQVTTIGNYAFRGCEDLASVMADGSLETIGTNAFYGCPALRQVALGDSLKSIGEKAFSMCTELQSLTMGRQTEYIAPRAFAACLKLDDITCKALTPPLVDGKAAFSSTVFKKATVTVPAAAIGDYTTSAVWDQFKNFVPCYDEPVIDVNQDGELTVADVEALMAIITGHDGDLQLYDINHDGEVGIADVGALLDLIMEARNR